MTCHHQWQLTDALPICSLCGKTPHVSPSQIETWWGSISDTDVNGVSQPGALGCQRKWGYDRITPRHQNEWAAFGDRVHKIRELWLTHGTPPDPTTKEGRCAMQGLDRLPMPGRAWAVELEVRAQLIGRLPHWIKIDVVAPPTSHWAVGSDVELIDHKTTGSLERAKTGPMLAWDPQWLTYARWAVDRGARRVAGRWEYLQRDGRGDMPVAIAADAAEIVERHDALSEHVSLPMLRANATPVEQLPRNPRRCAAFGPRNLCRHVAHCWDGVDPLYVARVLFRRRSPATRSKT